jgi:hypothetical protein
MIFMTILKILGLVFLGLAAFKVPDKYVNFLAMGLLLLAITWVLSNTTL